MNIKLSMYLVVSAAILPLSSFASIITVSVPGAADIYLAGQPSGSIVGGDTAPANSPVSVSGLSFIAGNSITFSTTGSTDGTICVVGNPDGCSSFSTGPANGISTYSGPFNALIGLFTNNTVPSGAAPAGLPQNTSFSSVSPLLNQVFFIGDGLTGTGTGSTQTFVIPTGATRLFLADSDITGGNFNNGGSFSARVNDNVVGSSTPEPATFLLMIPVCLAFMFLRKRFFTSAAI